MPIYAPHPFAKRTLNPLDEWGNEGCGICGRPRSVHPPAPPVEPTHGMIGSGSDYAGAAHDGPVEPTKPLKACEACEGPEGRRRTRCSRCRLLLCRWCFHHTRCVPEHDEDPDYWWEHTAVEQKEEA
jgi:hypothetical protein